MNELIDIPKTFVKSEFGPNLCEYSLGEDNRPNIGIVPLTENNNTILRIKDATRFLAKSPKDKLPDNLLETLVDKASENVTLLSELASFGVDIPTYTYAIGEGNDNFPSPLVYTTISRVDGCRVDRCIDTSDYLADKLEELAKNLGSYLLRKIVRNEPYLRDIFLARQYVFGFTQTDVEPKIYLVDIDTLMDPSDHHWIRVTQYAKLIRKFQGISKAPLPKAVEEYNAIMWEMVARESWYRREEVYNKFTFPVASVEAWPSD